MDHYSRTKSLAEQKVLGANGRTVGDGGKRLRTCALRCAGIYGEGEQRHLPRIVVGLYMLTIVMSVYLCLSVSLSVCLSLCLSVVCLPVCVSVIFQSVFLSSVSEVYHFF